MKKLILILLVCSAAAPAAIFINSFNSGQLSKDLKVRADLERHTMGSETLQNILVRPQGMAYKRPGTEYIDRRNPDVNIPEVPGTPAIPGTYTYTWLSENGQIWGVPLNNGGLGITLDNGGSATNEGGGIVSLPLANNPFVSGNVVYIVGTTYYNGAQTLTAGTTTTRIHFTDTYGAETFDGSETVVRYITSLTASSGRMCQDSSGNLYYGSNWIAAQSTWVTKIAPNGTLSYDAVTFTTLPPVPGIYSVMGIALSSDEAYLYVNNQYRIYKFDLSDGSETWVSTVGAGYYMALDADDNAYAPVNNNVNKFAAATGAHTALTLMGAPAAGYVLALGGYDVAVDDDLGIVIAGGTQYCPVANDESVLYNLAVRTFNNSTGDQVAVGGTYIDGAVDRTYIVGTGHIATNGSHIFVMIAGATGRELYKYSWDGSSLTEVTHITTAANHASGIYFDLWGNLVLVNNDGSDDDIFWFYDTDLNYLSKAENLHFTMLDTWLAPVGGSWIQGNALPNGDLGTPEGPPSVPGAYYEFIGNLAKSPIRLIPWEHDVNDAYVSEFGHKYIGFLRTVP